MHKYIIVTSSFLLLIVSLGALSFAATTSSPQIETKTANGIQYLSGGIGEDEQEALRALGQAYNLKLVFTTKEGHYLSDVAVIIKNSTGGRVLEAVSEGPWFYTDLPAGRYFILATTQGETRQETTHVVSGKQMQLYFHW